MGDCADDSGRDDAAVVDDFLKFSGGFPAAMSLEVGFASQVGRLVNVEPARFYGGRWLKKLQSTGCVTTFQLDRGAKLRYGHFIHIAFRWNSACDRVHNFRGFCRVVGKRNRKGVE